MGTARFRWDLRMRLKHWKVQRHHRQKPTITRKKKIRQDLRQWIPDLTIRVSILTGRFYFFEVVITSYITVTVTGLFAGRGQ